MQTAEQLEMNDIGLVHLIILVLVYVTDVMLMITTARFFCTCSCGC